MNRLTSLLRDWRWPVIAALVSAAMLATAHAFERFAFMAPCPLCLRQREVYWALIAMVAVGLALYRFRPSRRFITALNVLVGLVFLTGAIVATYHAGAEWKLWPGPSSCSGAGAVDVGSMDLLAALEGRTATVSCTDAPRHLLGLAMAGWYALVSLGLACVSLVAANVTATRNGSPALAGDEA